jgi:hypothetical protein
LFSIWFPSIDSSILCYLYTPRFVELIIPIRVKQAIGIL